jgi:SAM-dependent methyltransferase
MRPGADIMKPIVGHARGEALAKTRELVVERLRSIGHLEGSRMLDVGCGDGTFTMPLGEKFAEVYGIDVQSFNIEAFRSKVGSVSKYVPLLQSARKIDFPNAHFDSIISIETFEHIDDPRKAVAECCRVLKADGEFLITVPNRWFPCENHGGTVLGHRFGRLPLITYLPPIHDAIADARVFTVRALDRLFATVGFERTSVSWLWPTFEHGGNPLQRYIRPLFPLMRKLEHSPLAFLGTSIVARFARPLAA